MIDMRMQIDFLTLLSVTCVGTLFIRQLISSAFGNDDVLKRWIQGEEEGSSTLVADQNPVAFGSSCIGSSQFEGTPTVG